MNRQRRRSIALILALLCWMWCLRAQDSLVHFRELSFTAKESPSAFLDLQKGTVNHLALFLSGLDDLEPGDETTARAAIINAVEKNQKETKGKSEEKTLRFINQFVHQSFFTRYEKRNSFSSIFVNGTYNCVSATALFALILDRLSIPYQIRERPEHVYLVAYPSSLKIVLETTSPLGYIQYSEAYMDRYLDYLVQSKVITKDEKSAGDQLTLFQKYYYSSAGISLLQLAAIQFANYAFYHSNENKLEQALNDERKSAFIYRDEKSLFMLHYLMNHLLYEDKIGEQKQAELLISLCNLTRFDQNIVSPGPVIYYYGQLQADWCDEKKDWKRFKEFHKNVMTVLKDTAISNTLDFAYHYEFARYGQIEMDEPSSIKEHLVPAYQLRPNNIQLQELIFSAFLQDLKTSTTNREIKKKMEEAIKSFPYLQQNMKFNSVQAELILNEAYEAFTLNDVGLGEKKLSEFKALYDANKEIQPGQEFLERAYNTAASTYFKRGNRVRAKSVLKEGLLYAPDNFSMKVRLSQL
jgi:hypothetical protein